MQSKNTKATSLKQSKPKDGFYRRSHTLSCLATSLADDPETSIQVFENNAHADNINTR